MQGLLRDFSQVYLLELSMLCLIGAVLCHTSYTDIHFRSISNSCTWGLLGIGPAGQMAFWGLGKTGPAQFGTLFGASLLLSYLLFVYGFWSPGDAKLFWAVTVALPPTLLRPLPFFSFDTRLWALLLNVVILNSVAVMLVLLWIRQRSSPPRRPAAPWRAVGCAGPELAGVVGLVVVVGASLASRPLTFVEAAVAAIVLYLSVERIVPSGCRVIIALPGVLMGAHAMWKGGDWLIYLSLWAVTWAAFVVHALIRGRYL